MDLIYWSVRSFSRKGGNGIKGVSLYWPGESYQVYAFQCFFLTGSLKIWNGNVKQQYRNFFSVYIRFLFRDFNAALDRRKRLQEIFRFI